MGSRKKRGTGAAGSDGVDQKGPERSFAPAAELWEKFGEAFRAVRFADVENRGLKRGVAQKNPRQLETAIAGDAYNRDLAGISHFTRASIFFWRDSRDFLLGVMINTVSSPAMVPAISGNLAPSTAAARGCAPLGGVFKTRRFSAGRISRRNSPRARASGGQRRGLFGQSGGGLVAFLRFYQAELLQVARKRGLGYAEFLRRQPAPELFLVGNPPTRHQAEDLTVTKCLVRVHGVSRALRPLYFYTRCCILLSMDFKNFSG